MKFLFLVRMFEEFKRHVREDSGNRQISPEAPVGVGLPEILKDRRRMALDMKHLN